ELGVFCMMESTLAPEPDLHEPFMTPSPSLPQRNAGFPYSSAREFATSPRREGLHVGFPRTMTFFEATSRSARIFLTSLTREATVPFLSLLTCSRASAYAPASASSFVERRLKATAGSPILDAAFMRGV